MTYDTEKKTISGSTGRSSFNGQDSGSIVCTAQADSAVAAPGTGNRQSGNKSGSPDRRKDIFPGTAFTGTKLSEEQVKKKMNQAKARLEEIFLNRNPDLQHIGGNVSMPSEEPETGISLQW